jgi:hypothetical protein
VPLEPISASDLERFGYCPLSWWLSLKGGVTSAELREGERNHSAMAEDVSRIMEGERGARGW